MNIKALTLTLIALTAMTVLTSCNDEKLAKEIDGKWSVRNTETDEDGTKTDETYTYSFIRIPDDTKDGGVLKERCNGTTIASEDGYECKITYNTYIMGNYEFIAGDLYCTYDLSTLKVNIDDIKIRVSDEGGYDEYEDLANSALDGSLYDVKQEIQAETEKELRSELYKAYKKDNDEETCFKDVKIEGDKMTLTTDDGTITMKRVSNIGL